MGEAADMILEGILCEGCGEVFDDIIAGKKTPGYPRRCDRCQRKSPPRYKLKGDK